MADRFLDSYRGYLLDVDGVLVRGDRPLPGAAAALERLQTAGSVLLLTNNSTRSRSEHAERLVRLGFAVRPDELLPTSYLAAVHLLETLGPISVWPIGEDGLRTELTAAGHRLAEHPEDAQVVVVGMDRTLTYDKLAAAHQALRNGAGFLATNEDGTYPVPEGLVPGAGAMVGALRGIGYEPRVVVGKPSPVAFRMALAHVELPSAAVVMIGDRIETDIEGGQRAGLDTALVLSGVSTRDEVGRLATPPTWIADDLAQLVHDGPVE